MSEFTKEHFPAGTRVVVTNESRFHSGDAGTVEAWDDDSYAVKYRGLHETQGKLAVRYDDDLHPGFRGWDVYYPHELRLDAKVGDVVSSLEWGIEEGDSQWVGVKVEEVHDYGVYVEGSGLLYWNDVVPHIEPVVEVGHEPAEPFDKGDLLVVVDASSPRVFTQGELVKYVGIYGPTGRYVTVERLDGEISEGWYVSRFEKYDPAKYDNAKAVDVSQHIDAINEAIDAIASATA